MRNILILALHDLAAAWKNKTIVLVLFIPLFVFVSLQLIDKTGEDVSQLKVGILQEIELAPRIKQSIAAAGALIEVTWLANESAGKQLLKARKLDGVLVSDGKTSGGFALLVLKKDSPQTLILVERFSALQKAAEGNRAGWITDIRSLHEGGLQRQTLSTWILMLILLVGFIILPAQVAEEKEKKQLLALLQTPVQETQWLTAKLMMGMILIGMAVLLLHLLGGFCPVHLPAYIAFVAAGGFCFSAYGILLGLLCRTQASARTLGVIFYLPHLLPSALSDFSTKLTAVAPLLPSYQLYTSLQAILLEGGGMKSVLLELAYLTAVGGVAFFLSYMLMKRRWLM